jgi:hypothetical protein
LCLSDRDWASHRPRTPSTSNLSDRQEPARQFEALRSRSHVVHIEAHSEFALVHSDHIQTVLVVLAVPTLHHAEVTDAVDAGIFPKLYEHYMAVIGDMVRNRGPLVKPYGV